MALHIVGAQDRCANDFRTVEELGSHIQKMAALLRAAMNASDRDDEGWLVSLAQDESELAEALYDAWASPAVEEAE